MFFVSEIWPQHFSFAWAEQATELPVKYLVGFKLHLYNKAAG